MNDPNWFPRDISELPSQQRRRREDELCELADSMSSVGVFRCVTRDGVTVDYLTYDSDELKRYRRQVMARDRRYGTGLIAHRAIVCVHPENAEFAQVMIEPERVLFEVRVRQVDRPYVQGLSQAAHRIRVKSATQARRLLMRGHAPA